MGRGRNWSSNIHLREWHEQKKLAQQVEEEERKKKEKKIKNGRRRRGRRSRGRVFDLRVSYHIVRKHTN